ncbi:MAG: phage tail protein [Candidatus Aminicenantes bacterium]|nr:phage tail protein [Candidatus Aminicenantes bacterium]NIM84445.1 phage tail protein [Candidatus Aminicenantes bacterium]NIN23965.1 phage tail protein [Candidatus Aminicenantes bacterium]NIN47679.1 phage tail protein [Candidatus Aminicenantes bacterium]NIN90609.1 phage tail protein [Candidatus Aminicenantes bacterium]
MPDLFKRRDPYLSYRFQVEFVGVIRAGFSEVSGLELEIETEEYREGGVNDFIHKLPKGAKYPNIVLKKGITDTSFLWEWNYAAVYGKMVPMPGRIILINAKGQETMYWAFMDGYPVKWSGPELKADSNNVALETLEIAHSGMIRFFTLTYIADSALSMAKSLIM